MSSVTEALPGYYLDLGKTLHGQNQAAKAIPFYQRALALDDQLMEAGLQLGRALYDLKRYEDATGILLAVVEQQPDYADALYYLGLLAHAMGDTSHAVELLRHALTFSPDNIAYCADLATFYHRLGREDDFIEYYGKSIALGSKNAKEHFDVGFLYFNQEHFERAIPFFRRALELNPQSYAAAFNLGVCHLYLGIADQAMIHIRQALKLNPNYAEAYSVLLLIMQTQPDITREDLFEAHREFARRFELPLQASWPAHRNLPDPQRKLKVGYVSADFRNHSVAYFIRPVLAQHDRDQVEVFAYYTLPQSDAISAEIQREVDHWRDCGTLSDAALAQQIQSDGIDILVDLSGHTPYNRLLTFARKPAPLQLSWIGYIGTTGLSAIDYRLTDAYLDPVGMNEAIHSETLLRLPVAYTFAHSPRAPAVTALPALSGQPFTFACLNALGKITPENIWLWAEIMTRVPGSRMMFAHTQDELAQQRLLNGFAEHGVAAERLQFNPRLSLDEFLALHQQIDLALDPFPYNGGTTTRHALWMGVPTITLAGDRPVARCGADIMLSAGLPQFVAQTSAEYLEIAVRTAGDLTQLQQVRQTARDQVLASPAGDAARFTRELEMAYRRIWQDWCAEHSGSQ